MISTSAITSMVLAGLVCILYPVVLLLVWRKKTGAAVVPFFVGAGTFFLFALVLEQLCHMVFLLGGNAVSQAIQDSAVLYMLYGGFAAGIFEETGRFAAFKLMKKHDSRETAVTYGIGHGGIEAILIVGVNMLVYAVMALGINRGATNDLAATLQAITPMSCAFAVYERLVTVVFHIALSVLVFAAARRPGKLWLFPVAILIHASVDFIAALYQQGIIQSILLTEVLVTIYTVLVVIFALRVYRGISTPPEPEEGAE